MYNTTSTVGRSRLEKYEQLQGLCTTTLIRSELEKYAVGRSRYKQCKDCEQKLTF